MARVLVLEPSIEVRQLIGRLLQRLGHEALYDDETDGASIDVIVLEPADAESLATARALLEQSPAPALICASTLPKTNEIAALDPVAYLLKPFGLKELERAVSAAVGSSTAPR